MLSRLTYCSAKTEVEIKEILGGNGASENLNNLGLQIGRKVQIVKTDHTQGQLTLSLTGNEISLGNELASKILVETNEIIETSLNMTKVGDVVEVTKILAIGDIRFRLLDMGLVRGVKLNILRFAPLGDPLEVLINGFNLSMRMSEAKNIKVKILEFGKIEKNRKWKFGW
ncbi:MAG: ferrous iron transport protein A [Bacteroidetes bacterium]|nr:ferrous iron transport protein A [Bacteroidota bacterium]